MKRRTFLALSTFAAGSACLKADDRADARKDAIGRVKLRIEPSGWGEARLKDLRAVLKSSCSELAVHFDKASLDQLEPIYVKHDKKGPISKFLRTERGEILVLLKSKDRYWCQHAYQMAHEFGHILCRFKKGDRSNLWFEEAICELASMFAMRQMAQSWKTAPPYRNWKDYSKALDKYVGDLIEKYTLPSGVSLNSFYREHAEELTADATNRTLNGQVAVKLLPYFEAKPENWVSVYYLNVSRGLEKKSFETYFNDWFRNCPKQYKPFVEQLGGEFGVLG